MDRPDDEPLLPAHALTRRRFLGAVGTGAAALGVAACRAAPPEEIVPYVERPPEVTPGKSRFYATAFLRAGYAVGILGETREGRPIKVEGNPRHPASLGASGVGEQAALLSLYDEDRTGLVLRAGEPTSFRRFAEELGPRSDRRFVANEGRGLHLWLEPTSSPVTARLLDRLRARYPQLMVWFDPSWAPVQRWEGSRLAFGRVLETLYDFEHADRIVALDADFLSGEPMSLRWARHFAERRYLDGPEGEMNRLYAVEPALGVTGVSSDHRLPVRASEVGLVAMGLFAALGDHQELPEPLRAHADRWRERTPHPRWVRTVAKDLWEHRGRSAVVVGERQPPFVHALGHALNAVLDNVGRTVHHVRSPILEAGERAYRPEPLLAALEERAVDALVTLEANPGYTAPAAWRFGELARRAETHVHAAPYRDETSRDASWFLPTLHPFEQWGAARAQDGLLTPVQPLIRPLFGGVQVEQILATLLGEPPQEPRALLRDAWPAAHPLEPALASGLAEGTELERERTEPRFDVIARAAEPPEVDRTSWELVLQPDPRILDGRYANNAWLQELPEPVTKLVWDNAAIMSDRTARELDVSRGDVVQVKLGTTSVRLPVWPQAGMPERTVVAWLGYGRRDGGRIGRNVGVDVGPLRPAGAWFAQGALVRRTGEHYDLVSTQDHQAMEGRPIVLRRSLHEFREEPGFAEPHDATPESIYPNRVPENVVQWGMAIDLNRCTGCSACVIACQAENNVPSVGKAQVAMGREMHWLRIDRYVSGKRGEAMVDVQPMLCQHCEQAPCEYVCPVYATVHSPDGLNEMIYNRCVGTRFCSNNCPWKIRRFNWYDYHRGIPETRKMAMNPDVTVRARGVMEKCTYCVQRIRRAEIEAQLAGKRLRDMDVETACQQACPTEAIVFGQVSDPHSRVSKLFDNPRTYATLNELGTRPRTRYLARILNRNQELEE